MNQAAHDGASGADDRVRHEVQRLLEDREPRGGRAIALDFAVPGERADPHSAVLGPYKRQLAQAIDVDDVGGLGEPHVQDRDQALATRENLALGPGEGIERFVEICGPVVPERRGLHPVILLWIACPGNAPGKRSGSRGPRRMSEK